MVASDPHAKPLTTARPIALHPHAEVEPTAGQPTKCGEHPTCEQPVEDMVVDNGEC